MELRVLSEKQVRHIHEASMWILGKIGVLMPHTDMRARFREAGASVDEDSQHVRIPESFGGTESGTGGKGIHALRAGPHPTGCLRERRS